MNDRRIHDDDGYMPGDPVSCDRQRWLDILVDFDIPEDTWAAHMVWVTSWHSWGEAVDYARRASEAWRQYVAGLRSDWFV